MSETPVLEQLHHNAMKHPSREQSRALWWKVFAELQLELLGMGEYVDPNAMKLTVAFGAPIPERIVTYRRVSAEEFSRLSEKTPRSVENIARPEAANDNGAERKRQA